MTRRRSVKHKLRLFDLFAPSAKYCKHIVSVSVGGPMSVCSRFRIKTVRCQIGLTDVRVFQYPQKRRSEPICCSERYRIAAARRRRLFVLAEVAAKCALHNIICFCVSKPNKTTTRKQQESVEPLSQRDAAENMWRNGRTRAIREVSKRPGDLRARLRRERTKVQISPRQLCLSPVPL